MRTTAIVRLLPLFLALAAPTGHAGPPLGAALPTGAAPAFLPIQYSDAMPDRERELIQIIEDARAEADKTHSYKNARMGMQIRILNFYNRSHEFENWQGTVAGINVLPGKDVWINIKLAEGITVSTSPTKEDDPAHVTLIQGGTKLGDIAGALRTGEHVQFTATLMRFVNDRDDLMLNTPRMLAHFESIKTLD